MNKTVQLISFFIALVITSQLVANTFLLGDRVYKDEGGKWYNYYLGQKCDEIVPERMIIRKKNQSTPTDDDFYALNLSGISVEPNALLGNYYIIEIDPDKDPFTIALVLYQSEVFEYIEFDAIVKYFMTPNDEYFHYQWSLKDDKIQAEKAWDITTGNPSIIVSNIDSGTDYLHEDLDANIWVNLGEDDGDGIPEFFPISEGGDEGDLDGDGDPDDDGNGFIDDIIGWNFQEDNNDPNGNISQNGFHGTNTAGIIAAETNNDFIGIAGVAGGWNNEMGIKMMIVKINSNLLMSSSAECIIYAVENGADIINISWGWYFHYDWYEVFVDSVVSNYNCVLSAASGNRGGYSSNNTDVAYPAGYEVVIAVGASDENDERWTTQSSEGSSYGSNLSIVAPGRKDSIYTTELSLTHNEYTDSFGRTSAAAPHVTGIAALVLSVHQNLPALEVKKLIELTADKVAGMEGQDFHIEYGYGRVNAYKAVKMAQYMAENNILKIQSGEVFGEIIENTLLAGNVFVIDDIEVYSGIELHVYTGSKLIFSINTGIISQGNFVATGLDVDSIIFTSGNTSPLPGDWAGITVNSGNLELSHCELSYAESGVKFTNDGSGLIQNSNLNNCQKGIQLFYATDSSINIINNDIFNNSYGIWLYDSYVRIDSTQITENNIGIILYLSQGYEIINSQITNNYSFGLYSLYSSGGVINNNEINNNGLPLPNLPAAGILLYASSPVFNENYIEGNNYHGLFTMHSSFPIMNDSCDANNLIKNNGNDQWGINTELMIYDDSVPYLDKGHNDIYDISGGYLIYHASHLPLQYPIYVTNNYWADEDPSLYDRFYPAGIYEYHPYDTVSNTEADSGRAGSQLVFAQGLEQERVKDWVSAIQTYYDLIYEYPMSAEALGAIVRLYVCYQKYDSDFQALRLYYDDLSIAHTNEPLGRVASQYSMLSAIAEKDYQTAINWCEAILSDPPSSQDSLYAVIDIGQIYLKSMYDNDTGLSRQIPIGSMSEYRPVNFADYERKMYSAISELMNLETEIPKTQIPDNYALHQNYPNPFNPVTTIV
nr:S8 family serine peptidase [Candidatus Neomarinimicrobiota bacterium]